MTSDIEVMMQKDGHVFVPIKHLARLLELTPNESSASKSIFYTDTYLKQSVEINWAQQAILINNKALVFPDKVPLIRSENSFLETGDVFIEQSVIEKLLALKLNIQTDAVTIQVQSQRALAVSKNDELFIQTSRSDGPAHYDDAPIKSHLIERFYFSENSFTNVQAVQNVPIGNGKKQDLITQGISNVVNTGITGSLPGHIDYYIKPSIVRFNGKTNFQNINWLFQKKGQKVDWSLGSVDAGLSNLVSPTLPIWGLKFSSKNAANLQIASLPYRVYQTAKKNRDHEQVLVVNDKAVESISPEQDSDDFQPVYLQIAEDNHFQVIEKIPGQSDRILEDEHVAYTPNRLSSHEVAYSGFLGRAALQFNPLISNQNFPMLMPQSNKWLAGGRFYYGLSDKLTAGISVASSTIFGPAKTFFLNPTPFTQNLTGLVSYQRNPNFFQGQNTGLSLRYQLNQHWFLNSEGGISRFQLKPGSGLTDFPSTHNGLAGQAGVQYQTETFTAQANAFHYNTYYYTPDSIYNSFLYDKQGVGGGISGLLRALRLSYQLHWDHYQTNLTHLIDGGIIQANELNANIHMDLSPNTFLNFMLKETHGHNQDKKLLQRYGDLSLEHRFNKNLNGRLRVFDQQSDFIFPQIGSLTSTNYKNQGTEISVSMPILNMPESSFRVGNIVSSFMNNYFMSTKLQFHQVFGELSVQKSYGDKQQNLNTMMVRLGYQFKSGRKISACYQVLQNSIQFPNVAPNKIHTQQVFIDFTDVIGRVGNKIQSLGPQADYVSNLYGRAFADLNQNGKWESGEPGIPNIKLILDKNTVLITDKEGQYQAAQLPRGGHTVALETEQIPVFLNAKQLNYTVHLTEGKSHCLNIALLPEGGTLSGNVQIYTIKNKSLPDNRVVLVLQDKKGHVLGYTTSDTSGHYQFDNLSPNRYQVVLEQKLKDSGLYQVQTAPQPIEITASQNYTQAFQKNDLNFKLIKLE